MISFLTAIFSTLTILIISRWSYSNYVNREVAKFGDDRDEIDKIEDPFDLYSENEKEEIKSEITEKEIFKEEKKRFSILKGWREILKSLSAFISIFRILSYILLVVGFISLKNSGNLEIAPYLIGVTLAIISVSIFAKLKQS
jgi:hypothetical protein